MQRISSRQEASHLPSVPRPGSGVPLGGCLHSKWYPGAGWGPIQLSLTGKRSPEPTVARAPEQSSPRWVQPSSPEPRLGAEASWGRGPQKRPPQCQVTGVRLSGRVTASSSPGTSDCRQADSSLPAAGTRRGAWLHGGWAGRCLVLDAPHLRGGLQKEEHRAARVWAHKDPAPGLNLARWASHGTLCRGSGNLYRPGHARLSLLSSRATGPPPSWTSQLRHPSDTSNTAPPRPKSPLPHQLWLVLSCVPQRTSPPSPPQTEFLPDSSLPRSPPDNQPLSCGFSL